MCVNESVEKIGIWQNQQAGQFILALVALTVSILWSLLWPGNITTSAFCIDYE